MPTSKITWGAAFAKTITFEYPLFDVVTDREPREGSEWAEAPSGVREALIVGSDYTMECDAGWIRNDSGVYTPISGADSWQDYFDWARKANTFRFIPDAASPGTYIPDCYLVEPMRGFGNMDKAIRRTVRLKIKNPLYDFHRALMGTLYTGPA